jgi:predicted nucleotidyltransferase
MYSPSDREAVLARAIELLEADPRVEAAAITGSLGTGRADRWSDFDLSAIIGDGAECGEVAADWETMAYREWPVVHHYATEFGTTLVRGFLLRNGLLADLGFTPIADFEAWAPVKVVFDRTGSATKIAEAWEPWTPTPDWPAESAFAAHDVLHACSAANRGRRWQALYFLQRIRTRNLSLASERHGLDSQDLVHVDELPPAEVEAVLGTLVTDLETPTLLRAIDVATRAFLDELRRGDSGLADRLEEPLGTYVSASRQAAAAQT